VFSSAKFSNRRTPILHTVLARPGSSWPRSAQQSGDTDIFVDSRPVNPLTATDETELGSLFSRGIEKPGEPDEGNADAPAVGERNRQLIL